MTVGRLQGTATFAALRNQGRKVGSGPLIGIVRLHGGEPRVGYAIPTAVAGAVTRNRIRRRLREIMRTMESDLPRGDLLVRVRPAAAHWSFQDLAAAVTKMLRDAALLADPSRASK